MVRHLGHACALLSQGIYIYIYISYTNTRTHTHTHTHTHKTHTHTHTHRLLDPQRQPTATAEHLFEAVVTTYHGNARQSRRATPQVRTWSLLPL
jgi:hypothetical protein